MKAGRLVWVSLLCLCARAVCAARGMLLFFCCMCWCDWCVSVELCDDFLDGLSCCASGLVVGVWVSDGYEDCRLLVVGQVEQLLAELGVEVAYPACAESYFCCCEADVFGGDGYVDVAVVFAVDASVP